MLATRLKTSKSGSEVEKNLSFLQYIDNDAGQTSYTFSGANLGAEASDRVIVVCAYGSSGQLRSISNVTLDGTSMESVITNGSGQTHMGIFRLSVPTGTTANIVVTFNSSTTRCGISMYSLTGYGTVTTYDTAVNVTGSTTNEVSIDTINNGSIIGFAHQFMNPVRTITSVVGFDVTDVDTITDSTSRVFSGSSNITTTATNAIYGVTFSALSTQDSVLVAASFT